MAIFTPRGSIVYFLMNPKNNNMASASTKATRSEKLTIGDNFASKRRICKDRLERKTKGAVTWGRLAAHGKACLAGKLDEQILSGLCIVLITIASHDGMVHSFGALPGSIREDS